MLKLLDLRQNAGYRHLAMRTYFYSVYWLLKLKVNKVQDRGVGPIP